jgi:hypothetical protein
MKRSWTVALMLAFMLVLPLSVPAFAQDTPADDTPAAPVTCPNFVDEDEDGVCDNLEQNACHGHGMGMGMGLWGRGHQFVDEDGDGVCDNCPAEQGNTSGRMGRMGLGWRMGQMFHHFGGHGWNR